jgi:HSP20 family molecular chaperone IbpA
MKTITSLFLAGVLVFTNCNVKATDNSVKTAENASMVTDNRSVSPFTKIENSVPLDIVLEKGSKESVTVEVTGTDPKNVHTEVTGNTLKVDMEKGNYQNLKGKITITYVNISEIETHGSGDLTCKSELTAENFALSNSGSGDVDLQGKVKTKLFTFQHSGSGDVVLASLETADLNLSLRGSGDFKANAGSAQTQIISISGSGDVQLFGVSGETCTVAIKGSGNIETNVSESIIGSILGSGNVSYKGEPKTKQVEIKGSGSVSKG